ncbi:MAG: hypothetical protein M4D80_15385 [Myxococcota bacterium]|nr:hypothetical protein [Myxococcota bacterium]
MSDKPFQEVDLEALATVAGGASRVSSRAGGSSDQLTAMLTQITSSIKELGNKQSGGMDPMMMMMMMMMGGGGGAAGGAAAAAPVAATPVINVEAAVSGRGCGGRGKKGW